jgi:molecular chaperone Hsp33
MKDYTIRATAADGMVRAFAAITTEMVREARNLHSLSPVASAALGRTLTAAALMSKSLKGEKDKLTIQIKGEGPLGGIVVVSDSHANVRGYVYNPDVHLPLNNIGKLDVSGAIGPRGHLNVIRDLGLKEPYIGYVDLISGEIAEDIAYYYLVSEQIPSVVALGVLLDVDGSIINAGGYILQLMPGASEELIDFLEKKVSTLNSVTSLLSEGKDAEAILEMILGERGLVIFDREVCRYECNCSRDRMERNLISLGEKELIEMINDDHGAELQCHFCNKKYFFTEKELRNLIKG